jgi:hypothetical protein
MMIAGVTFFILGVLLTFFALGVLAIVHRRSSQSAPLPVLPMQDLSTQAQAAQLLATAAEG